MRTMIPGLLFLLAAIGCESGAASPDDTAMSACCEKALTLRSGMSPCCVEGMVTGAGCCEMGMAASTPDAERPECCKNALAALAEMSPCCREAMQGGDVDSCCVAMKARIDEP